MAYEIQVFTAGKHTSSDGRTLDIGVEKVDQAISNYNPGTFRVPLIVSHETGNYSDKSIVESELAFGVVDHFKRVGDKVFAVFNKISEQFKEWVEQGMLHSVSSGFYLPESPTNPYPGEWAFRHIAALGKNPPAVKGMAPLELSALFTEGEAGTVNFCEPYRYSFRAIAYVLRGLRDWIITEKGLEAAETVLPSEIITQIELEPPPVSEQEISYLRQELNSMRERFYEVEHRITSALREEFSGQSRHDSMSINYGDSKPMYKKRMSAMMSDAGFKTMADFAKASKMKETRLNQLMAGEGDEMTDEEADFMSGACGMKKADFMKSWKPDSEYGERGERKGKQNYSESSSGAVDLAEENARLRKELTDSRIAARRGNQAEFVQEQLAAGRLTPALVNTTEVAFSAGGEDQTAEIDLVGFMAALDNKQLAFFRKFIGKLPRQVEFKISTPGAPVISSTNFEEDDDNAAPKSAEELGMKARQLRQIKKSQGINLSEAEAVDMVLAGVTS